MSAGKMHDEFWDHMSGTGEIVWNFEYGIR